MDSLPRGTSSSIIINSIYQLNNESISLLNSYCEESREELKRSILKDVYLCLDKSLSLLRGFSFRKNHSISDKDIRRDESLQEKCQENHFDVLSRVSVSSKNSLWYTLLNLVMHTYTCWFQYVVKSNLSLNSIFSEEDVPYRIICK